MDTLSENKRGMHDYDMKERFHAGIILNGQEVKSIKLGRAQLTGSFVVYREGELFWVGATIPAWQVVNAPKSYEATRTRKLLLSKKQIAHISSAEGQDGLTVVPLSVYNKGRHLKLSVAIARGKKKADKRQDIKKRDVKRQIERTLKTK